MKHKIILILIIVLASILRFYQITTLPALNADEAALGYNAYSLIHTGKDEHGQPWPLVFKSFGDFKPGVYIYLTIPFIKLFGLNVLAVRLPGLILSIVSVYLIYLLVKELMLNARMITNNHLSAQAGWLPYLSAFLLAISPWHLHFSRGAWETQVSTSFLLLGTYAFLRALKSSFWYLIFVIFYILALYTYHSMRVVAPLLALSLLLIYRSQVIAPVFKTQLANWKNIKWQLASLSLGVLLLIPLFISLTGQSGLSRAQGVSIFADPGPVNRVNEARGLHQNFNSPLVKILYNRPVAYGLEFFDNYLSHFSGNFLFLDGDEIQRNKVPEFGQLYLVSIPFLFIGLFLLITNYQLPARDASHHDAGGPITKILFSWLLIAPIPAALTFQSPHALRSFSMVIPLTIITALGLTFCIQWGQNYLANFNNRLSKFLLPTFYFLLSAFFFWDFTRYLHQYYQLMVPTYSFSSQYGFSELVPWVESVKNQYDRIYVTDRYDQPYILFLFYSQYPPEKFQSQVVLTPRDKFGFSSVRNYDQYHFESITDFNSLRDANPHSLVIGTDEEIPDSANIIKTIFQGDHIVFQAAQT